MLDTRELEGRRAALAELIGTRLRVGGATLEQRLKRAGRLLPRWARRDAARFVEAGRLAAHPKLARQIDETALDKAEARLRRYLTSIDPDERRTTARLHLAGGIVLKVLIIAAVFLAVLRWQGLL
ncbi:hypothetical protein [Marinovum sp.]|uniref:hypothetical protein n=1 Tax=Marinovum sp. TaxID=2024839 RepID=UPI002B26CF6C|nr:hypothetical protein [Marinovum sp.]